MQCDSPTKELGKLWFTAAGGKSGTLIQLTNSSCLLCTPESCPDVSKVCLSPEMNPKTGNLPTLPEASGQCVEGAVRSALDRGVGFRPQAMGIGNDATQIFFLLYKCQILSPCFKAVHV